MAGPSLQRIYCWDLISEGLHVYTASTEKGALRICLGLGRGPGPVALFRRLFPECKILKDYRLNAPLIETAIALLEDREPSVRLPMDITGTPFQVKVWNAIASIPFGETRTYGEVARQLGSANAARAVGQAVGRNPLPLIFP